MRVRHWFVVALSMGAGLLFCASQAQAADATLPFTNWQLNGSLTLAKLRQAVPFPSGSTFNGSADLTTDTLSGNVFVPPFTSAVTVFGIPTKVALDIQQASPVSGSVVLGTGGTVTIKSSASDNLSLESLGLGPIRIPAGCHTSKPLALTLDYSGPLNLTTGFSFSGTTTIPPLTGCGILGPVLSTLLSGPGNTYSFTLTPPAS
jgi:hypothetical protein